MFLRKSIWIIMLMAGAVGGIVYFPVPIDQAYTCLADHSTPENRFLHHADMSDPHRNAAEHTLLHRYLKKYAFLWWTSLLVAALSGWHVYRLFRQGAGSNETKTKETLC